MTSKWLHMVTFSLMALGALNWGLVGLINLNIVSAIFGAGSMLERVVYILVGVSAAYILATHMNDCKWCAMKGKGRK